MKKINLIILISLFSICSYSQSFMPGFSNIGTNKGMVIKQDGDTIKGTFFLINHPENIKKISIKDKDGIKHKFEGAQINKVFIKINDLAVLGALDGSSSVKDLNNTDLSKVTKSEYYIYERAITPKKGKTKVMQLVNHGFDSKMKVYRNPTSGETGGLKLGGVKLTGGIEKSYYVVKQGENVAVEIKKGDYKKQYGKIFTTDCAKMSEILDGKKPDWDDISLHVYTYSLSCE